MEKDDKIVIEMEDGQTIIIVGFFLIEHLQLYDKNNKLISIKNAVLTKGKKLPLSPLIGIDFNE